MNKHVPLNCHGITTSWDPLSINPEGQRSTMLLEGAIEEQLTFKVVIHWAFTLGTMVQVQARHTVTGVTTSTHDLHNTLSAMYRSQKYSHIHDCTHMHNTGIRHTCVDRCYTLVQHNWSNDYKQYSSQLRLRTKE